MLRRNTTQKQSQKIYKAFKLLILKSALRFKNIRDVY